MQPIQMVDMSLRFGIAVLGMYLIYQIEREALKRGINGRVLATAIGLLGGIAAALLGIHLQDVLFK